MSEKTNLPEIPKDWVHVKLRDVCNYKKGKKPKSLISELKPGFYPYILVDQLEGKKPKFFTNDKNCPICSKNDILLVWDGSVGKNVIGLEGVVGSTIACLTTKKGIIPKYLQYFLEYKKPLIQSKSRGTGLQHVNPEFFWKLSVPLAPINEQYLIISKIEELFSKLDVGLIELERIRKQLKNYRKTLLNAAIKGEITKNWRDTTSLNEIGSALISLEHTLKERNKYWNEQYLKKIKGNKKIPKNEKWKSRYKEPAIPKINDLPSLPNRWAWATMEQLASFLPNSITDGPFGSNLKTSHYTESGPRVIRLQNVGDGIFNDEFAHISQEHFDSLKKHHIDGGDLVIAILGDPLPRACIIPDFIGPALVKADCIKFKPNTKIIMPKYLNYVLNAETTRNRLSKIIHGVGRPRLNLGEIKSISVPVPPLSEQKQIITNVEQALTTIYEIEKTVNHSIFQSEKIKLSILEYSFKGKLVPQNPSDEPALILLKRIKNENGKYEKKREIYYE